MHTVCEHATRNQSEEKDAQDKELNSTLAVLLKHWQMTRIWALTLREVKAKRRSVHSLKSTFFDLFKSSPCEVQTENRSESASTDSNGRWHAGREHCFES